MLEAAGAHERGIDGREIVPRLLERETHGVEIAKGGMELQRARKQTLAQKQLQQPPSAGYSANSCFRRSTSLS